MYPVTLGCLLADNGLALQNRNSKSARFVTHAKDAKDCLTIFDASRPVYISVLVERPVAHVNLTTPIPSLSATRHPYDVQTLSIMEGGNETVGKAGARRGVPAGRGPLLLLLLLVVVSMVNKGGDRDRNPSAPVVPPPPSAAPEALPALSTV